MIIDAHAHLLTPSSVFAIRTVLHASNGQHAKEWYRKRFMAPGELEKSAAECVALMDKVGTDIQLISPRPFTLWHSHNVPRDVDTWVGLQNDLIYETVQMYPDRFRGVAGLPQVDGHPIEIVFDELDRCINELGFVGVLLNPDPAEGRGTSPRLGDNYWYPLWERVIELDVPVHIHSAGCCGRETYDEHFATEESLAITSVIHSDVFEDFPRLKLMISHGGGSIPYQIGRWRSHWFLDQATKKPHIAAYFRELENAGWAGDPLPEPPADLTTFDDALTAVLFRYRRAREGCAGVAAQDRGVRTAACSAPSVQAAARPSTPRRAARWRTSSTPSTGSRASPTRIGRASTSKMRARSSLA